MIKLINGLYEQILDGSEERAELEIILQFNLDDPNFDFNESVIILELELESE